MGVFPSGVMVMVMNRTTDGLTMLRKQLICRCRVMDDRDARHNQEWVPSDTKPQALYAFRCDVFVPFRKARKRGTVLFQRGDAEGRAVLVDERLLLEFKL